MRNVIVITGPTASGKTDVAVKVAGMLNGEIISADSRQVYKHMPIATSQPTDGQLLSVRHYYVNELKPDQEFNAGEFGIEGRKIIEDIFSRGKLPLVTGGSGLYVRSLIDGFFEEKIDNGDIRIRLYEELDKHGEEHLYAELSKVDSESAKIIPPRKIRRVIRALEVYYASGKRLSELHKNIPKINFKTLQFGLSYDRRTLYDRINRRVDKMIENGLLNEVKALMEKGYHYKKNYSVDTVGIKEIMKYFEGEYDLEEAIRLIKQNTRRYAKRQLTWFRKDKRINWIETGDPADADLIAERICREFRLTAGHS